MKTDPFTRNVPLQNQVPIVPAVVFGLNSEPFVAGKVPGGNIFPSVTKKDRARVRILWEREVPPTGPCPQQHL
jgi:hypothetical protein